MKTRSAIKNTAAALVLIVVWSLHAAAQTVQYVTVASSINSGNLPLQTNQLVSLVGYIGNPYFIWNLNGVVSLSGYATNNVFVVTGATNVQVSAPGFGYAAATFQITTPASAIVVSNYVPADAVVIPASATGNVQIILESSPDLVNWTAAEPGIYGASAGTNRFFRVRAVVN